MDTPTVELKKYDRVIFGGMALLGLGAVAALAWGIVLILPTLVAAAENGVIFLALCGVAVALGITLLEVALNFQNIVLHMKMTAQSIRRKVISANPIAAIDVSIANITKQYEDACRLAAEADGATKELAKQIHADDKKSGAMDKAENEDLLAQAATKMGRPDDEVNDHLVKSQRWHRTADTLQPLLVRQQARQKRIEEARKVAKAKISDLNDQKDNVSIMLRAYEADAKQSRALGAFFGKSSKDMANIEIAVDEVVRQGALAEAQIEQMLTDAEPEVQQASLQREADAEAARARLGVSHSSPRGLTTGAQPVDLSRVRDAVVVEDQK